MRVMIAGGSGLIGHELTSTLINYGDEVVILSRNPNKVKGIPSGVQIHQWDGKTIQAWAHEVEHTDAVVNLTGENLSGKGLLPSRWTANRKPRLLSSRVNSGKVLTSAIEMSTHKPAVFVQASGIGYYAKNQPGVLTEADGAGDDFLSRLSIEWESSSASVESMGVRRVIVRNGVVLSTEGGALPFLLLPYRLFVGGPLGNGKQVYSWIHIKDEVNGIRFLIQNDRAMGAFNMTSPNPVSNNEFGRMISKVMKRPHYFPIPGFAMHLAFGEVASVVLDSQKVLPAKLLGLGYTFQYPQLSDTLRDLLRKKII